MVVSISDVTSIQKPNAMAQRRNVQLIRVLFSQIQRDILLAAMKPNAEQELKYFTTVNLMTSKKYKDQIDAIVDAIDGTLKKNIK